MCNLVFFHVIMTKPLGDYIVKSSIFKVIILHVCINFQATFQYVANCFYLGGGKELE